SGREDDPVVRVGELRREGIRGAGELRHRALPEQSPGIRLRDALLPRQPARPAGAVDHADAPVAAPSGHAAGVSARHATAAAAGELRVRTREDAGGVHAQRTAGLTVAPSAPSWYSAGLRAVLVLSWPSRRAGSPGGIQAAVFSLWVHFRRKEVIGF